MVSTNCFCFCSPSEAQSDEWKGTPQRERAGIAPLFPASQVNSTDDRLVALMDDMVTFSLVGNQCVPSSLSSWQSGAHFVFIDLFFLSFTPAGVAPTSVYIEFEIVN